MLHFVLSRRGRGSIGRLCKYIGKTSRQHIRIHAYEDLRHRGYLPRGCFAFGSLEGRSSEQRVQIAALAARIRASGPSVRVLNDPACVMTRYELLRTLHERGLNEFNVFRLDEARSPKRYPVFLRRESDHQGNITPLLQTEEEFRRAVAEQGHRRSDTLAVEFVDTSEPDGIYRKHSALIVGESVFPAHLFSSRQWMVKLAVYDVPDYDIEMEFIETNPHREQLENVARISGIEWGRIDYGIRDGRVQVFEINTNPMILTAVGLSMLERRPTLDKMFAPIWAAMVELAKAAPSGRRIPIADLPGYRPPGWRRTWNRLFTR